MVADRQQPSDGNAQKGQQPQHQAKLQKAVPILQDSYSKTFNDRVEYQPGAPFDSMGSKKAGVLGIVNVLFAMYFRLNILRLCKNLIRPVETRKLHESGTMADMVTYRYYIGRLNMFEDQHGAAEVSLDYALRHCHRASTGNKKRILRYLIPVKLLRGKLPTAYGKSSPVCGRFRGTGVPCIPTAIESTFAPDICLCKHLGESDVLMQ